MVIQIHGGCEEEQLQPLMSSLHGVGVNDSPDRLWWGLDAFGEFTINQIGRHIDDVLVLGHSQATRWCKVLLKKVRIFGGRLVLDCLPTLHCQKRVVIK